MTTLSSRSALCISLCLLQAAVLAAEKPSLPDFPWQMMAVNMGLSPVQRNHLQKEKVLMVESNMKQIFEAYFPDENYHDDQINQAPIPYFVTSDALFQAFAWCLKRAVEDMETQFAFSMGETLPLLLNHLPQARDQLEGDDELKQSAYEQAVFVLGVAVRLLEHPLQAVPKALEAEIDYQYERVQLAKGTAPLTRLAMAADDFEELDYTLFKPVSIYARQGILGRYFRVVRWLQLYPFQVDSARDMLSLCLIRVAMNLADLENPIGTTRLRDTWEKRIKVWEDLIGREAGLRARIEAALYLNLEEHPIKALDIMADMRKELIGSLERGNNPITSSAHNHRGHSHVAYILPGSATLDQELFELLSKQTGPTFVPKSLSIPYWLGSDYAGEVLAPTESEKEVYQKHPFRPPERLRTTSLHSLCLDLNSLLLLPPPADAPAFMKTRAWQAKSCQTAAVSWMLCRHIWALQTRPQSSISAGVEEWPAFIEPVPDYFTQLANISNRAGQIHASVFSETLQNKQASATLRELAAASYALVKSQFEVWQKTTGNNGTITTPEGQVIKRPITDESFTRGLSQSRIQDLASSGVEHVARISPSLLPNYPDDSNKEILLQFVATANILLQAANDLDNGVADGRNPNSRDLAKQIRSQRKIPFQYLETICLRLANLAHKQLRGLSPTEDEHEWVKYFGIILGSFSDCRFRDPLDDTPKCVTIFTNARIDKALTIGIGRPAYLYVLYPWKGKEILCRGGVLPFLESHNSPNLTDQEWKERLNHPQEAPIRPDWISPLMTPP
jgi:hypothetical protein